MSYKESLTNLKNDIKQAIHDYPNLSAQNNSIKHGSLIIKFSVIMNNLSNNSSNLSNDILELLSNVKSYMCDLNKLNKKSLHNQTNHTSINSDVNTDVVMKMLGGADDTQSLSELNTDKIIKELSGNNPDNESELNTEKIIKELSGDSSDKESDKLFVGNFLKDAVKHSLKRVEGRHFNVLFDASKPEIVKEFVQFTSKFVSVSHDDFMSIKYKFLPINVNPELFDKFIKISDFSGSNFGYILVIC